MIVTFISALFAMLFFVILLIWVNHKLKEKQTENHYAVYRIQFKDSVDKVPITQSVDILSYVTVAIEDDYGYVVHSDIDDHHLKSLMLQDFNLKPSQFIVTSRQFMNF